MRVRPLLAVALLVVGASSCTFSIDPNGGRFSCGGGEDCGAGYECRPQAVGDRGLCYRLGDCVDQESCNGKDDDCNGLTDEAFPEEGAACQTALLGACRPGKQTCVSGALACAQLAQPAPELCNGSDDDCDGQNDETFDLTRDDAHCGACANACSAGTLCRASSCHEASCANGSDDDGDGALDCDDPDCAGLSCDPLEQGLNCGKAYPDAGSDGGTDAGTDAGSDGGTDAGTDAGQAPDAGLPIDAGGEPDGGAKPDGGSDAGTDGGSDPLDGGSPDGGAPIPACVPREFECGNGADDDWDGQTDCADQDCDAKECRVGASCANRECPPTG